MLLQQQPPPAGQDLPSDSAATTSTATASTPSGATSGAQFASTTLASLLSAQEAPPSASDVATKVINAADTNGDGALSLSEIETAIGADTTSASSADALS